MPSPLLNPQVDNPSQASLLGASLIALLKKHISEPFQLTLLNIGVSNFSGVKGAVAGSKHFGWHNAGGNVKFDNKERDCGNAEVNNKECTGRKVCVSAWLVFNVLNPALKGSDRYLHTVMLNHCEEDSCSSCILPLHTKCC